MNRTEFSESIVPGIKKWMDDEYKQYEKKYVKVANVFPSEKAYEEFINSTGLTTLPKKTEGGEFARLNPLQGYKTRLTAETYGAEVPTTAEEIEDDLYNIATIENNAKKIGKAAGRTEDKAFWSMLNNGFDTSYTSYGDDKPLFSTTHPRKDGGSNQSNASTTGAVFSGANLFPVELAMTEILDDVGEEIDMDGKFLIVIPPALKKTVFKELKSDLEAGTADNDTNYYFHGAMYDMMVVPYLGAYAGGSDTAWYVLRVGLHGLTYVNRKAFSTTSYEEEKTGDVIVRGRERFSHGWLDWRGSYGSKGDGISYTD